MKRQSIIFILLLLQVLLICIGCGSSDIAGESPAAAAEEGAAVIEEAAVEEAAAAAGTSAVLETALEEEYLAIAEEEIIAAQKASNTLEDIEDVVGVFEGLEDNHTAIFSFEDAEMAFYFDEVSVQTVLYEAVLGSPYTLSYHFDDTRGLNVIYEISE